MKLRGTEDQQRDRHPGPKRQGKRPEPADDYQQPRYGKDKVEDDELQFARDFADVAGIAGVSAPAAGRETVAAANADTGPVP